MCFFCQAEDGIRDLTVTGVQTCALPIYRLREENGEIQMITTSEMKTPRLVTALPGPKAKQIVERDAKFMSPSFTRDYPLVAKSGHGAMVEDVDVNVFLDFAAGVAVHSIRP